MIFLPIPATPQDALRQVRIVERATTIADELKHGGQYYAYGLGGNVWQVYKRSGTNGADQAYILDFNSLPVPSCTCPDFTEHKDFCKHTVALGMQLESEADEAMCEEYERMMENAEGPNGCEPLRW